MKKIGIALAGTALAIGVAGTATAQAATTTYTRAQVAQHASTSDCWTIIGRSVYNLTPYVSRHPGGPQRIAQICGTVGTAAFNGQHGGSPSVQRVLKAYRIGSLAR